MVHRYYEMYTFLKHLIGIWFNFSKNIGLCCNRVYIPKKLNMFVPSKANIFRNVYNYSSKKVLRIHFRKCSTSIWHLCIAAINPCAMFVLPLSELLSIGLLFPSADKMSVLYVLALAFHAHYRLNDFQLAWTLSEKKKKALAGLSLLNCQEASFLFSKER